MYQRKSKLQGLALLLLDCICITVSLVIANYLRNGRLFESDNQRMDFSTLLSVCLMVYLAAALFKGSDGDMLLRGPLQELAHIAKNNILMFAGAAVILYLLHLLDAYSRLVFFIFILTDCILMLAARQLWKRLLPSLYRSFGGTRKLLAVADRSCMGDLLHDLEGMGDPSYELTGAVVADDPGGRGDFDGIKVVSDMDGLVEYCRKASLDEVVVAVGGGSREGVLPKMEALSQMGITVHYQIPVPDLGGAGWKGLSQFGHFYTVTYANRAAPAGQLFLKRLLDLCGAAAGCAALIPLTLILGPLIRLGSAGPVFFSQERVGRNGRIFKMYKFRSMYADAEERKSALAGKNEMSGLMFKMDDDPRVTKLGRFMRRTSLDEFPQFINILKGDMSLVGTRPPTLDEFAQYSPYHKKRLSFRPGLTGMWQAGGRSGITDFEEVVRLDVEYIDNWSIMLDIKILLKTVLAVFSGSGAR